MKCSMYCQNITSHSSIQTSYACLTEAEKAYRKVEDGIEFQKTLEPGPKEAGKGMYAPTRAPHAG